MKKRTIKIFGESVDIQYNMATQIAYEEITGKGFDPDDLNKTGNQLAMFFACLFANNPDSPITFDMLLNDATAADIALLRDAVIESLNEWAAPAPGDEPKKEDTGKNS